MKYLLFMLILIFIIFVYSCNDKKENMIGCNGTKCMFLKKNECEKCNDCYWSNYGTKCRSKYIYN